MDLCRGCQLLFWLKVAFFKNIFSTGSGGVNLQFFAAKFKV